MPAPTRTRPEKNIWVAAGDGDLDRVRELVETQSLSPNVPDPYTYTPMHAAASYGHLHVLDYLISQGGDVNVADNDGDTPLYVVENVDTARFLVQHGADARRRNAEGVSPAEYLAEDFQEVAAFLQGLPVPGAQLATAAPADQAAAQGPQQPSQHAQNTATEALADSLLQSAAGIMQQAEAEGRDPEEELRRLVSETVLEGVAAGYGMAEDTDSRRGGPDGPDGVKRSRMDDGRG